jgi:hypothetical protein
VQKNPLKDDHHLKDILPMDDNHPFHFQQKNSYKKTLVRACFQTLVEKASKGAQKSQLKGHQLVRKEAKKRETKKATLEHAV